MKKKNKSIRDFIDKGKYSQNGEHGILMEVIRRIWPNDKTLRAAVEFGAPNRTYCSNIAELPDNWGKFYFDSNPEDTTIKKAFITPENVNEIIGGGYEIVSIDVDGGDFGIWKAYNYTPAVVIIEINSSIPPDRMQPINSPTQGTGYLPMKILGESKGYFLLCHTGNLIFVRKEYEGLFPDKDETFDKSWL